METDDVKYRILGEIAVLYDALTPVLRPCGITRFTKLPEFSKTMRLKRLEDVLKALSDFTESEAVEIFKKAESLRSPGVLALWAEDEVLSGAREVKIYRKAVNLVRSTWRETEPLPQFFRIRKVKNGTPG